VTYSDWNGKMALGDFHPAAVAAPKGKVLDQNERLNQAKTLNCRVVFLELFNC
jgi:hypothetical protein